MEHQNFFQRATGKPPYDYQVRLAEAEEWPDLLEAPTGAGKTEAIVLAWLWRRRHAPVAVKAATPRRLAYCLPMRVLVEQTRDRLKACFERLGENIPVEILMGGEGKSDWDLYPEREAVLIGTQDMLLSRAINRGYALSRARWPMPYGLLNNDCLWVFDEVQLMGSGLATTAQLAAFRESLKTWGHCQTLWVSATLRPDWLETVDFRARVPDLKRHTLSKGEWTSGLLRERLNANKTVAQADNATDEPKKLAEEIRQHHQPGTLTLVIVNTVKKAVALYAELNAKAQPTKRGKKEAEAPTAPQPELVLLHSRFRSPERQKKVERALDKTLPTEGRIVVSTQVVEAGVDISARVLFTELAPWPSLVQRVGRCNRYGEIKDARVFWLEVETKKKGQSAPYGPEELDSARAELKKLDNIGPRALRDHLEALSDKRRAALYLRPTGSVIRKKDVLELFNTTADLTGSDLDVSPFIREGDERDAQVLWRDFGNDPNDPEQPAAQRNELCPVPVKQLDEFVNPKGKKRKTIYRWDFLEDKWERPEKIVAGQVYLLSAEAGGYDPETGWNPDSKTVTPISIGADAKPNDSNKKDTYSLSKDWQTLAQHTDDVVAELESILQALGVLVLQDEQAVLRRAARWHDWGKAHYVFQNALCAPGKEKPELRPPDFPPGEALAKSPHKAAHYEHPGFRHELASALAMLRQGESNLACYIVAAHHGKVRVSIRSMPNEKHPDDDRRFARGVWEGDEMKAVNLGSGVIAPAVTLSLECMESGLSADGQPSWAERMLTLLSEHGPFRLAYLEILLCAADRRASAKAGGAV